MGWQGDAGGAAAEQTAAGGRALVRVVRRSLSRGWAGWQGDCDGAQGDAGEDDDGGNGNGLFIDDVHIWKVSVNNLPPVSNLNSIAEDASVTVSWYLPPSEQYDNDEYDDLRSRCPIAALLKSVPGPPPAHATPDDAQRSARAYQRASAPEDNHVM